MRRTIAVLVIAVLFLPAATVAQERVFEYSTSVEPDTYVFDQDTYQRDENGDRVRGEDGRYLLEPQFVTLHAEARMDCAVAPDGEEIKFSAANFTRTHATSKEVNSTYFDLKPDDVNFTWKQDSLAGEWYVDEVIQVQILSDAIPRNTIADEDIYWEMEMVDIPRACPQEYIQRDVSTHAIIIPGFDFEPTDYNLTEDDLPGGKQTPAPGALLVVGALGLAAAVRRRP